MNNSFIILAAGNSERFKSKIPKSYSIYRGKPLLQHSIDKVIKYGKFKKIVLVIKLEFETETGIKTKYQINNTIK